MNSLVLPTSFRPDIIIPSTMTIPNENVKNKLPKSPSKLGMRHFQSVLLFLCNALSFGMRASLSVAVVAMTDQKSANPNFETFDWSSEQISLIFSSAVWGSLVTQIPVGYLTRKSGAHKFLCFGTMLTGIACMLIPAGASNFGWIAVILCRVMMGIGAGTGIPCIFKLIANWVPPSERARLGSFILNGAQFGTVASLLSSGLLVKSNLGWPCIFYIYGAITVVWGVVFYFFGADTPSDDSWINLAEKEYINNSLGKSHDYIETKVKKFPYKSALKSKPVWASLIVNCGHVFAIFIFLTEMPAYFKYVLNFNIQESGMLSALPFLATWLCVFPISWLSDFALKKGVSVTVARKVCTTVGTWTPALCLLAINLIKPDNESVYVFLFVMTLGLNAAIMCGAELNHIDIAPNFSGTLVSFTNTLVKISGMIAPIFVGQIVTDMTNAEQWRVVFYTTAAIYFLTNLIFLIFGSAEKQSWDNQENVGVPPKNIKSRLSTISIQFPGEFNIIGDAYK